MLITLGNDQQHALGNLLIGESIMKGFVHRVSVVLGCVALCASIAGAQDVAAVSGVPGDGIPDFYYFVDGSPANTSAGLVAMPAGTLTVDSDGADLVAMFVGGADVSTAGCALCDGQNLPGADALAGASTWTLGFSAGSSQWIRTNPLQGNGFRGVIGNNFIDGSDTSQPWPADVPPFLNFSDPNAGIANYGLGASFNAVFNDGTGEALWEAQWATDASGGGFTNVTMVAIPEPAGASLFGFACLGLLGLRRRS